MNPYCKLLCPICNKSITMNAFKNHMNSGLEDHDYISYIFTDELMNLIYACSTIKTNKLNAFVNWDYILKLNYKLTEKDKKIFEESINYIKHTSQDGQLDIDILKLITCKKDKKYCIPILFNVISHIVFNS